MYHKWLRSFHAVAREGGFTAAARALNVGQPTVSEQVRALEDRFGVELFHRQGRAVRLTATGRQLLAITQDIFGHEEEAVRFLAAARAFQTGALAIGAANPYVVMHPTRDFLARYPRIDVAVAVEHHEVVLQALLDFRMDVAVLGRMAADARFCVVPYRRCRVDVLVGADHPWAARRAVRVRDLAGQRTILREPGSTTRQALEGALAAAGVEVRVVMEINSREAIRDAVMLGLGIGVASEAEFVAHDRLRAIPVSDADMFIAFHAVCLAERRHRPLIGAFMDMVEEGAPGRPARAP